MWVQLSEDVDSAWSDDTCCLKTAVVGWLKDPSPPAIQIQPYDKCAWDVHNDSTGKLLCPVEYDWDSLE